MIDILPCRKRVLLFVPFFVLSLLFRIWNSILASPAHAGEAVCPVPSNPEWTSTEKQVWVTLCKGLQVDLSQDYSKKIPSKIIRSQFLEEILRDQKYKKVIESRGVNIVGAHIKGFLNLSYATLSYLVQLTKCTFADDVSLRGLRTDFPMAFVGSTFLGALDLSSIRVGEVLVLDRGTFNAITLQRAQIQDELLIRDAIFNVNAVMSSMKIGSSLMMRNSTFKGDVDLHASSIGHDIAMQNSSFHGMLNLSVVQVRGNVHMGGEDPDRPSKQEGITRYKKVDITGGEIQGNLVFRNATIEDELTITGAHVRNTVMIDWVDLAHAKAVRINFSDLGELIIDHTNLPSLDITATTVNRRLGLGNVKWYSTAKLTMRATEAYNLNDLETFWPQELDMRGFVYKATFSSDSSDPNSFELKTEDLASRSSEWLKNWLARQVPYSPQPYKQLAGLLQSSGYREKSKEILFENKERELSITTSVLDRCWLMVYRYMSGYGIYPLDYAVRWTCSLVFIGCLLLYFSQNPFKRPHSTPAASLLPLFLERRLPFRWSTAVNQFLVVFIYSLDRFLPGTKLREHIYPPIQPTGKVWWWFQLQQAMGYVVAVFLIAGLSGLVEK